MKIRKHLIAIILIFIGGILVFSSLYQAIEGWNWLDSFYFVSLVGAYLIKKSK